MRERFSFHLIKNLLLAALVVMSSALTAQDKDWKFDPKTSSLIPNYLGTVKVLRGAAIAGDRELAKGSKVYAHDLISTKDKSLAVVEFIDQTTITMGPNSEFTVEKWDYKTKNDREMVVSILKGQLRALFKSKAKNDNQLKIKTPSASMGIRGTEFLVNVLNQGAKEITQVALVEGLIRLFENNDKVHEMVPGDHIIIVKSSLGAAKISKKLKVEELNMLKTFEAPEIKKLLDPVVFTEGKEQVNNDSNNFDNSKTELNAKASSINAHEANPSEEGEQRLKEEEKVDMTLKEKLEELNDTRKKNLAD